MSRAYLASIWLVLALPLAAQQPVPLGKIDLNLPALTARAVQVSDVTLDGAALRLGLAFLTQNNYSSKSPDEAMLRRLQGVYVKSLEFRRAVQLSTADLAPIRVQLRPPAWSRIVTVQERHPDGTSENDEIYVCTGQDGAIHGMAILNLEAHEVNVVNVVGPIKPSELAVLGGHLGIPKSLPNLKDGAR